MARFFQLLKVAFPSAAATPPAPPVPDTGAYWADSYFHTSYFPNSYWF